MLCRTHRKEWEWGYLGNGWRVILLGKFRLWL